MPNLRNHPLLVFQIPSLLLVYIYICLTSKCNIIHCNWVITSIPALIAKCLMNKPYVITVRGEDIKLLSNKRLIFLFYLSLKYSSKIISVNQNFIDIIASRYNIDLNKFVLIQNGVDIEEVTQSDINKIINKYSIDFNKKILLFIGSVIPRKNIEELIRIIQYILEFKLIICGRIEDQKYFRFLESEAINIGVQNNIQFLGQCPPSDIPALLTLCHFYISASKFEGRPNSILEAISYRKFVFASDIEAHREIITNNSYGELFLLNNSLITAMKIRNNSEISQFQTNLSQNFSESSKLSEQHSDLLYNSGQSYSSEIRNDFKINTWLDTAKQYKAIYNILLLTF